MEGMTSADRFRGYAIGIRLSVLLVLFSCGSAAADLSIPYDVKLEGVADKEIRGTLDAISDSVSLKKRPPATLIQLRRRADGDVGKFLEALKSEGCYDAVVDFTIDEEKKPVLLTFRISPGEPYPLISFTVEPPAGEAPFPLPMESAKKLGLELGKPARAAAILEAGTKLENYCRKEGYPFAKLAERRVVVDRGAKNVAVAFVMELGPLAYFGPTHVTGLQGVAEDFVRSLFPWREGDKFNADLLQKLRQRLAGTDLFSVIRVTRADALAGNGLLAVAVEVTERKFRTVSAGARYATDEGPGGVFSWEDRNLFGAGERLHLDLTVSSITYSGNALFKKPDFLRSDQAFLGKFRLGEDNTDAYLSYNTEMGFSVERAGEHGLRFGAGPDFRIARVREKAEPGPNDTKNYALASIPAYLEMDATDNSADPTRGGKLVLQLAPYTDLAGIAGSFFRLFGSYAQYVHLVEEPDVVFAGKIGVGSIAGGTRDSTPADVRFYAGGGGSVRGWPFQKAGPLVGSVPVGGNSLLVMSSELRFKVTKEIGFVAFLDGGSDFGPSCPDPGKEPLRWGSGAGIRYFTPVGPVRLDFAIPLNRPSSVSDTYQIYVGIGQAF